MYKRRLLTNDEAAEFIGISPRTLISWRSRQTYQIPYSKIGGLVRYDPADLDAWIASRKVGGVETR
jgi:predicted DNA-binding transcriptional regulator AlpA